MLRPSYQTFLKSIIGPGPFEKGRNLPLGDILKSFNEPLEEIKGLIDIWLTSHFILRILIFVLVDGDLLLRSFDQVGVCDDLALVACSTIVWTFNRLFFGFGHFGSSNVRLIIDFFLYKGTSYAKNLPDARVFHRILDSRCWWTSCFLSCLSWTSWLM